MQRINHVQFEIREASKLMQILGSKRAIATNRPQTTPHAVPTTTTASKPTKPYMAPADDSTAEPMKRGRGRPPKHPPIPIADALPDPPHKNLYKTPEKLFKYWDELSAPQATHCEVKVYRHWPVIDRKLNPANGKNSIDVLPGKSPFGSSDWKTAVMNKYGCGDYSFYLNETPGGREVCMCFVTTVRDFINYPPLLDKRELMVSDPQNASYMNYMRQRGQYFPGDAGYEGTEEEQEEKAMEVKAAAAVAAAPLETMARALESMTDRVVRNQEQPDNRRTPAAEQAAAHASIKMTQEAASSAIDMHAKAADRLASSRTDAADPIKQFEAVAGLIERISGNGNKDGGMMAMILKDALDTRNEANRRANDMQRDFVAMLEKRANGDGDNKPKSMLDQLKELKEMKALLKDDGDDEGESNGGGKKGKGPDVTEMLLAAAPILGQALNGLFYYGANMMHNYAAAKTGAQAPQPPNNPAVLAAEQQQQIQAQSQQQTQAPVMNGNGQPQQSFTLTPEQEPFAPYHKFLAEIQGALIHHLQRDDLGGFNFAQWLINSQSDGRLMYEQIKSVGPDVMLQLLKSYPPLWQRIGGAEARVTKFVETFLDYDNEMERLDKEDEEGEETD